MADRPALPLPVKPGRRGVIAGDRLSPDKRFRWQALIMNTTPSNLYAPEKLQGSFDELAKALLQAANGREVIFLQNNGNYGDCLIRYGTIRFFQDIGLPYREYDMGKRTDKAAAFAHGVLDRLRRRHLYVYSGSGAWATVCSVGFKNVHRQIKANRNIFILPTTFQRFGLPEDILVFVRDRFESWKVVPHAKFCHDMAFYLALVAPERLLPDRIPPERALGLAFRTDNEARTHGLAKLNSNVDISATGTHSGDPHKFLRMIDRFEELATDRLHVAIGALLLGKRVFLTEGIYFKMRAIYNSSVQGIFANCDLVQDSEMYTLAMEHNGS
jgi:Polysaccharide pyruvyl transferase